MCVDPDCAKYDTYSRWSFFALNIAAEPEMQVWTATPQNLSVTPSLQSLVTGENTITITINSNNLPSEGATICLKKETKFMR